MSVDMQIHGELVHSQWQLVELLERMPSEQARALRRNLHDAQQSEAAAALPRLKSWPALPRRQRRVYSGANNQTRMYRVCQFLSSDDRILDIGTNYGYFAGLIAALVRPAAYTGIDLAPHYLDGVRQMAATNGLDISHWTLETGDLYKLTPEWVAKHDPTIILLLEVLEHLPDPGKALQVLANVMPEDGLLLFSVPMLGRLDGCWGHRSLFDADRVRRLCAAAGLHVQWVEPVLDVWKLVLAGPSRRPHSRLSQLVARPTVNYSASADPRFHVVKKEHIKAWRGKAANSDSAATLDEHNAVRLATPDRLRLNTRPIGLAFPVDGLEVLRIEFDIPVGTGISQVVIRARTAGGNTACGWAFRPTASHKFPSKPTTYVLRPGQPDRAFSPFGMMDGSAVRTVEISMTLRPMGEAALTLRRVAYVRSSSAQGEEAVRYDGV